MTTREFRFVLLGDPKLAVRDAFFALTGNTRHVGRLLLNGDAIEFALLESEGALLFLSKMEARPFHTRESLDILLGPSSPTPSSLCSRIVFAMAAPYERAYEHGQPAQDRYLLETQEAAGSARVQPVRWEFAPSSPERSKIFVDVSRSALDALLPGARWRVTSRQPESFTLPFPKRFPECYGGDVMGWGVNGEQLRADIPVPTGRNRGPADATEIK